MDATQYLNAVIAKHEEGNATEHSYRGFVELLFRSLFPELAITNEPQRAAYGAPDFLIGKGPVPIAHIEAKDIGVDLTRVEKSEQGHRYLKSLPNLVFTDYLEWRWFVKGELKLSIKIADYRDRTITPIDGGPERLVSLLKAFVQQETEQIASPERLAEVLANQTHLIKDIITEAFRHETALASLVEMRRTFAETLLPGLESPDRAAEFADMFAQTLTYGLFAARCNHDQTRGPFERATAASDIPKTNPFLRKLFDNLTGVDLDDEPFAGVVDTLVAVLASTNIDEILKKFGQRTGRQDPVLHFYETFLAAYDPKLREVRGVYYTPEPVVDYMVRSVDAILKEQFDCAEGIADTSKITYETTDEDGKPVEKESHKVLILDPACGTGTFLYNIIDHIRSRFMEQGNAGMWSSYVREHILPRLFGFELLMAPYAVAHLKLGMQLGGMDLEEEKREDWKYDFASDERLGVYLTNTLDEAARDVPAIAGPLRIISEEAQFAAKLKSEKPIMVVIGNPPYSGHSANASWRYVETERGRRREPTFIGGLVREYYAVNGQLLNERNTKWLQDDYVKFLRWGTWRIEQSGGGILSFITNHSYLDNPTFRGMRYHLLKSYDDIYIVNLHGNSKKKEKAINGGKDENVFNIQQGVAIGIFVRARNSKYEATEFARVHYRDVWGDRVSKNKELNLMSQSDLAEDTLKPKCFPKYYNFKHYDVTRSDEYSHFNPLDKIFENSVLGFQTHRDALAIGYSREELTKHIARFLSTTNLHRFLSEISVKESRHWKPSVSRENLKLQNWKGQIHQCLYRAFDIRYLLISESITDRPRRLFKKQLIEKDNICIVFSRQTKRHSWAHVFATRHPSSALSLEIKDGSSAAPLYLYNGDNDLLDNGHDTPQRRPNLNRDFIHDISAKLGLTFIEDGTGNLTETLGPEDIFHYMYAIFHSPTYRERYAEFLKIDFPRVPLTSDRDLFRNLCALGRELTKLHLMETFGPIETTYPVRGDDTVTMKPKFEDDPELEPGRGRVWFNKRQYFSNVPEEVWDFHIGGYQVCEKWLKDRKGRTLTFDDIGHYERIVAALGETIRLMEAIDDAVPGWPIT